MRKLTSSLFLPALFLSTTTLVACSFSMRAGSDPNNPSGPNGSNRPSSPSAQPSQTQAANTPVPGGTGKVLRSTGRRPTPSPSSPSSTPTTPPAPSTPPASGTGVVTGATIFGGSAPTSTDSGFKGNIYFVNAGATAIPDVSSTTPNGFLFISSLNIAPQPFTTGFPGVDANRKENFVIRYEGPLVVGTEADYDLRVVAEDGAKLYIDGMEIVNNDGVKSAPADKTGPVHLVVGTHALRVDYLQTTGSVALQVFCKKDGGTEQICPNKLP